MPGFVCDHPFSSVCSFCEIHPWVDEERKTAMGTRTLNLTLIPTPMPRILTATHIVVAMDIFMVTGAMAMAAHTAIRTMVSNVMAILTEGTDTVMVNHPPKDLLEDAASPQKMAQNLLSMEARTQAITSAPALYFDITD